MLRMDERLSEDHPQRSAARHYGFTKTAQAIGDVPLDVNAVSAALREHYSRRLAELVYQERPTFWSLLP